MALQFKYVEGTGEDKRDLATISLGDTPALLLVYDGDPQLSDGLLLKWDPATVELRLAILVPGERHVSPEGMTVPVCMGGRIVTLQIPSELLIPRAAAQPAAQPDAQPAGHPVGFLQPAEPAFPPRTAVPEFPLTADDDAS